MIPVLTPAEMNVVDAAAPEAVDVLVARAGAAVARAGLRLLGGGYGRRVVVIAGKGSNGADGRVAAVRLARRGVRTLVLDAADPPPVLPPADLVIDAAYGTGFRGEYRAPDPGRTPVLAVDIPSGVDGLTGAASGEAVRAALTVTFAALKPGLLLEPGRSRAGSLTLADIGLDASGASAWVVELPDVANWLPDRAPDAHKWQSGVFVVAGSAGMGGAARLCAAAAQRAGAGMVLLGVPGGPPASGLVECVERALPAQGWDAAVLGGLDRVRALALGPGLGRAPETGEAVRRLVSACPVPLVVDADGLGALGDLTAAAGLLSRRPAATVLTPHAGEFARLTGGPPGPDRFDSVRELARVSGATVLLKGAPSLVAGPDGRVLVGLAGDRRLATAGTGDVLSGVIAAFLARGLDAWHAAGAAMVVHGAAARLGWRDGLVASDLLPLLPAFLNRSVNQVPEIPEMPEVTRWR